MGDLFMSLIHTCELNGANPFDYLNELQRHAGELKRNASEWMPWNYRDTWRGSPRPRPRNTIISDWPKRIDRGHGYRVLRNLEVCDEQEEHTFWRIDHFRGLPADARGRWSID